MKPDPAQLPDLTAEQRAAAEKAWAAILGSWPFRTRRLVTHHVEHWRTGLLESANLNPRSTTSFATAARSRTCR